MMDKNNILHQYLNGTASKEDIEKLKADPDFAAYLKIAETTKGFEVPNFKDEENFAAILEKLKQTPKVRRLGPVQQFLRIAAVVAIVVTSYVFFTHRDTSIATHIAERETFRLPDNSEVVLNAMSQISYNKKDWKKQRNLTLQGEAYFKVEKGEKFNVITSQGTVSVLGTQFNVYVRENTFHVQCFEGLVRVAFGDMETKVPAGSFLEIQDNQIISFENTTRTSPSWVVFESSFKDVPLETVLEELKRQYPIEVHADPVLNKRFTGSFTHKDLSVALRTICEPLQLDFKIEDDEVTLYAKNSN